MPLHSSLGNKSETLSQKKKILKECYKHLVPELFGGKMLLWVRVAKENVMKELGIKLER